MNYLEKWAGDLLSRQSRTLNEVVRVTGTRKAHLGPRLDFAQVTFAIAPASGFEVSIEVSNLDANRAHQAFIESAVFGFLDVAMLAEPYPYKNVRLHVLSAEFDPVSSNAMAFRLAGRDAGQKFLDAVRGGGTGAPQK
jgi:hypothetical protein